MLIPTLSSTQLKGTKLNTAIKGLAFGTLSKTLLSLYQ